jgi:hypothetical protein
VVQLTDKVHLNRHQKGMERLPWQNLIEKHSDREVTCTGVDTWSHEKPLKEYFFEWIGSVELSQPPNILALIKLYLFCCLTLRIMFCGLHCSRSKPEVPFVHCAVAHIVPLVWNVLSTSVFFSPTIAIRGDQFYSAIFQSFTQWPEHWSWS